jgi:hypothetical protein
MYHHLNDVNMTYLEHMCGSLKFSLTCMMCTIIFFIHALLPDYFVNDGSLLISKINDELEHIKKNSINNINE